MISSNAPRLPLLTTTPSAENTSSVVGKRPVLDSAIFDPLTSLPVAGLSFGASQIDVQRTQQRRLGDRCGRVGRQHHVFVQRQLHCGIKGSVAPLLGRNAGDTADSDVVDHDGRVLRQRRHVGHFDGDRVRATAMTGGAGHRQGVQPAELTTGQQRAARRQCAAAQPDSVHPPPPGSQPGGGRCGGPGSGPERRAGAGARGRRRAGGPVTPVQAGLRCRRDKQGLQIRGILGGRRRLARLWPVSRSAAESASAALAWVSGVS